MNPQMQTLLALFRKSQSQTPESAYLKQKKQLRDILLHAFDTVPFYQRHYHCFARENIEHHVSLSDLPIVTRDHIQQAGETYISKNIPPHHGKVYPFQTSGSTGKSINTLGTDFTRLVYDALMLREHEWHKRDATKTLMAIRWAKREFAPAPLGHHQLTWGQPINQYLQTGESIFINVASETKDQVDALLYYKPSYLMSYPSQVAAIAEYCSQHNISLPYLEEICMTGETLTDHYKHSIHKALPHCKLTDYYSSEEFGIIANQCAEYQQYHINTESLLLEIVDDNDNPVKKGEIGRILLTSLINYATPLIRYEIGDYAEMGEACQCGMTLPVIKKIHGRKRNRLRLPNGESLFPYLGEHNDSAHIIKNARKFQFIQHTVYDIEIKLVMDQPLSKQQEAEYKIIRQKSLGYPFNITISYPDHIPLSPTGKHEEFISLVE